MDADDISYQSRFETQTRAPRSEARVGGLRLQSPYVDRTGVRVIGASTVPRSPSLVRAEVQAGLRGGHPRLNAYRLARLGHVRYREEFRQAEDTDFLSRLVEVGPVAKYL